MHMANQDVSLSDMQWKQIEEQEKLQAPFSSDKKVKISNVECSLKTLEKVRTFLISSTWFACKNNA